MADVRGLDINQKIYNYEARIYRVYDNVNAKHRYTLSSLLVKSTLEMRHYTNIACKLPKHCSREKGRLFGLALGYCDDVRDSLDHLNDMGLVSDRLKSSLDQDLDEIRVGLTRLTNSFTKKTKEADRDRYACHGDLVIQEEV